MNGTSTILWIATSVLLTTAPLSAQGPGGGATTSDVPMGRTGFQWQTEQALEREALAELEAEMDSWTEQEWLDKALAWIAFDSSTSGRISVDDSFRVGGLEAGKKIDVSLIDDEPMVWEITYDKKPPKDLELILTDDATTHVGCNLRSAMDLSKGYLGVFMHDGILLCMPRAESGG